MIPPRPAGGTPLVDAVVQVVEDAGATGVRITALVHGVQSRLGPDATRAMIEKAAGTASTAGRTRYDIPSRTWFDPDIQPENAEDDGRKLSERIVELLEETHVVGRSIDGDPFIAPKDGHVAVLASARRFRETIQALAWREFNEAPANTAIDEVVAIITGMSFDAEPEPVWLRVAPLGRDGVVIDIGDPDDHIVVVTPDGWSVTQAAPPGTLFVRTRLSAPMPIPASGGDINDLWSVVRIDADRRDLVLAWVASSYIPEAPHLILALVGEQGTAKTETLRALSLLIDPLTAPTRTLPRDLRDLAAGFSGSWSVAFDNVSRIPLEVSDAICRAATGDSWVTRQLFTNAELSAATFQRIVMLDGIDLGTLRGDFLDRAVILTLNPIPSSERRPLLTWNDHGQGVRDQFEDRHPALLGAILDHTAKILGGLSQIDNADLPRMADAAILLAAYDQATGGCAIAQYEEARKENVRLGVESDHVSTAVRNFAIKMRPEKLPDVKTNPTGSGYRWTGTAAQLLERVTPINVPKGWPTTAQHFAGRLRRGAPGLREVGIDVSWGEGRARRTIDIVYNPNRDEELGLGDSDDPEDPF